MTEATNPGPRMAILPQAGCVEVRLGGELIARSRNALALKEISYQTVLYIPRGDIQMEFASRTAHKTTCPHKGEASYYSFSVGGRLIENAAWSYEAPHQPVAAIAGCLAFYPDRVDEIAITS